MNCPRCNSQMASDRFVCDNVEVASWGYAGWHCIICGTFIDPVILINRPRRELPTLTPEEVIEFNAPERYSNELQPVGPMPSDTADTHSTV